VHALENCIMIVTAPPQWCNEKIVRIISSTATSACTKVRTHGTICRLLVESLVFAPARSGFHHSLIAMIDRHIVEGA
jgi:hypothetical protein